MYKTNLDELKMEAWIKFAAHALGCLLVDRTISPEDASARAAEYADSMMKQLEKRTVYGQSQVTGA